MPETTSTHPPLTPAQLTGCLATVINGPYADDDTGAAADLTAETIRYLNYAAPRGGITQPATIATTTASLATAIYRLPQLLTAISDWITAEISAGRIADDHDLPPAQLTAKVRTTLSRASDHADELAAALNAAHNLTAALHAGGPAAQATANGKRQ